MPKKKATFQPTVRPDWAGAMEYIPETEQSQIFQAILMFPAIDLPNSAYWNKTIKPDLKLQFETFIGSCEKKSIGIRKRWENTKGIDMNTNVIDNYTNESEKNTNEQDMIYIVKDKDKNKDNDKVNDNSLFNAGFQNWVFPPEIKKVASKHWSAETIREIEKRFSCQEYNTETCIFDLLSQYPEDKTKRFVKPTVEEIKAYCQERNNNIDADQFFNYYEGNGWKVGKNPMKDWKAVIRTWEKRDYNKPQQPQKKNWSNYTGEGSFLKDAKDDPFLADIYNKKD